MIDNLSEYIDLPQIYYDMLSNYPDRGVVLRLNFLPAVVFLLVLNYGMSVECLFFDHFAGLSVVESLLELHQASQFLGNLYCDAKVQGLYAQSVVIWLWNLVWLTPVLMDFLIADL